MQSVPRPLSTRRARGCCSGRQRAVDRCVETDAGRTGILIVHDLDVTGQAFEVEAVGDQLLTPVVAPTRGADRAGRSTIFGRDRSRGRPLPGRSAPACRARRSARRTLLCSPYVRSQSILASPGAPRPCQRPVASTLFASGPRAPPLYPNGVHIASRHIACRDEEIHDGLADRPGDSSAGCDLSGPHNVHNGGTGITDSRSCRKRAAMSCELTSTTPFSLDRRSSAMQHRGQTKFRKGFARECVAVLQPPPPGLARDRQGALPGLRKLT